MEIHIHEDDSGLRNLYPKAAVDQAERDMEESRQTSERNRDPSGFGWTDVHVINAPKITYVDAGLRLVDAVAALEPIMPRIRKFTATASAGFDTGQVDPYGSYETEAWCFGAGANCFIKLEPKGELVERIWFDFGFDEDAASLRAAIEAVDALAPSMIADYRLGAAGCVDNRAFLDAYFQALTAD